MRVALRAARAAGRRREIPVGAIVARGARILAAAGNRTIAGRDPAGHAEIVALRRAARVLGNHRLVGTTLVVTLEPCLMCFGAMIQARIGTLVYGAADPKVGAISSLLPRGYPAGLNHRFASLGGILAPECAGLLQQFFRERRRKPS